MYPDKVKNVAVLIAVLLIVGFCGCSMKEDAKPGTGTSTQDGRSQQGTQGQPPNNQSGSSTSTQPGQPPWMQNNQVANDQAEIVGLIERLVAQRTIPADSKLGYIGSPNGKAYSLNDQGHLQVVDLAFTNVTDEDLAKIAAAESIEILILTGTKITNAGVKHLVSMPKLMKLDLFGTQITDEAIEDLAKIKTLAYPGVHNTAVTEQGMEKLKAKRSGR